MINFKPSAKLKKLQKLELEILEEFKRVCQKHCLKYFASGGTLLGAIRHKGFIPWDDDIDVQMMWDDYKKLLEIGPKEFKYPYFFQSYETDSFGEVSNSKIRRSDTTGCTKWEFDNIKSNDHNRGVFIDIFPLFDLPIQEDILKKQKENVSKYWKAMRGWLALQNNEKGYASQYEEFIPNFIKLEGSHDIVDIKARYLQSCAVACGSASEIAETSLRTHDPKFIWKKEWFKSYLEVPFENTTIAVPSGYNQVLSKQYGDWKTPVYGSAIHEMHIVDLEVPFSEKNNLF